MPDKYGFQIYGLEIFPKLILLDHTNGEEINTQVLIKTPFTVDSKQNKSIKILCTELFILHFIFNKHCYILLN